MVARDPKVAEIDLSLVKTVQTQLFNPILKFIGNGKNCLKMWIKH